MTTRNPILEEIYAAREQLLAECGGDVHSYVTQARERAIASGHPIAVPPARHNSGKKSADSATDDLEDESRSAQVM